MFFKDLPKRYFEAWMNFANFKAKSHLIPIDFYKPWWHTIWLQKAPLLYIVLTKTIETAFFTLIPTLLKIVIDYQSYFYFACFIMLGLIVTIIQYISDYYSTVVQMNSISSLQYSTHQSFLTVDPIYHTTRSSGTIIGKIDRGMDSYEDMIDILTYDFLPTIVGIMTVVITLLTYDFILALIALILIVFIGVLNTSLQILTNQAFEPKIIDAYDQLNNVSIENLSQIHYIRSSFASNEINKLLKEKNIFMLNTGGTALLAFFTIGFIIRFVYIASLLILGFYLIYLIQINQLTAFTAASLILTYVNGSREILKIGRRIRKYLKSLTRIKDLFNFIQMFGNQTYPVLKSPHKFDIENSLCCFEEKNNIISIDATNISFDYTKSITIFDNHSFHLDVPCNQSNKLYGIIGPSGIGKTTFVSILGGQLKPQSGTAEVQAINIYKLDDKARRKLIALQGQVASSLRGTLRYNILFGLPSHQQIYNDQTLIEILEKVGLWDIFKVKGGLDTSVGESGFTLSGGQRQRLNFANLYLRAHYYKPCLILIDEPTSSLDEISEQAITHMIDELAEKAVTLVIAHRLKTVENAKGIIDFSLIQKQKKIIIYSKEDLLSISPYYKKLIKREVAFD